MSVRRDWWCEGCATSVVCILRVVRAQVWCDESGCARGSGARVWCCAPLPEVVAGARLPASLA